MSSISPRAGTDWLAMPDAGFVALGLVAIVVYMAFVLPRIGPRRAAAAGAAMALAGVGAALWLSPWWAFPAVAAAFGHTGWLLRGRVPNPRREEGASAPRPESNPTAPTAAAGMRLGPDRATLGRYRIDRELGRGSMGAVYLGHDPQIGRQVAIKTMALSREFEGRELADARARFFREAETAGRLQHSDIVTIFDAGEEQELAFIAMEYLKGHDLLPHTLPAQRLPVATVLRTLERVARALAYAHRQGVVHRDIKPANVMIDLAADTVKVTDFGIASIADACRTRTGLVLGTPSFMSPEQMAGRRVDGRTDLYSLGVMLFQLLTGELPHRAESMARLMHQIANETAPDVRTLRPELPEALANVVALALEKRPETRYADGLQMADDLLAVAQLLDSQPVPPAPEPAPIDTVARTNFGATLKFSRADPRHNSQL